VPAPDAYTATSRTTPTRYRERASYDRAAVHAVLDEALVAHVGLLVGGVPVVLPTVFARRDETLYLHGSTGSRLAALDGTPVCVTVTLVDGLVLARSWLHHSAAYRSVVVHGTARRVTDPDESLTAMGALLDHVAAGRSGDARPPTAKEFAQTAVIAVELVEVSLKARGGHVGAEPIDLDGPYWAGLIPLRTVADAPVPSPDLRPGISAPDYALDYRR
jgi:nitroimidazol reductase NimA-like FMN-containing flavoprotein (pyridoxamine 5'-phosphate oxidase superfamily)